MRFLFSFFCVCLSCHTFAQSELHFDDGIILRVEIDEFNYLDHYYDTCSPNETPYICRIDGEEWFGMDRGMELPKYQLKSLIFIDEDDTIFLDVSRMYNPTFYDGISNKHFLLEKSDDILEIFGWFSDGAGTYCAKWIISNSVAHRILLSNSEDDCFN